MISVKLAVFHCFESGMFIWEFSGSRLLHSASLWEMELLAIGKKMYNENSGAITTSHCTSAGLLTKGSKLNTISAFAI